MSKNTILITGGTGFAGSHLVEHLLEIGIQPEQIHVTTFSNRPGFVHKLLPNQSIHKVDLTNPQQTNQLFETIKPDQIYHLAATAAVGSSFDLLKETIQNNLDLQLNVLDAVQNNCPEARILNIGSALEYDTSSDQPLNEKTLLGPNNPYAVSKVIQEMLAISYQKANKLDIVFVRPFNHIGERQASGFVVSDFAKQIALIENKDQEKISVGNLAAVRDFSDVKDIVKGYELLMRKGETGEIYNLGSGMGVSIQEILDYLIDLSNSNIEVEVDQSKYRPIDVKSVIADNNKVKQLGWSPTINIKETLSRALEWWRNNL